MFDFGIFCSQISRDTYKFLAVTHEWGILSYRRREKDDISYRMQNAKSVEYLSAARLRLPTAGGDPEITGFAGDIPGERQKQKSRRHCSGAYGIACNKLINGFTFPIRLSDETSITWRIL